MQQSSVQTLMARDLRQHPTGPQHVLWAQLRDRRFLGCKFRRKAPVGPFIVDFLCVDRHLIIEIGTSPVPPGDLARDAWLLRQGYAVLRLTPQDVLYDLTRCLRDVQAFLGGEVQRNPIAKEG